MTNILAFSSRVRDLQNSFADSLTTIPAVLPRRKSDLNPSVLATGQKRLLNYNSSDLARMKIAHRLASSIAFHAISISSELRSVSAMARA